MSEDPVWVQYVTTNEVLEPTMLLRWRVSQWTTTQPPVLEQMWKGDSGSVEWRPVPVEVVG